MNKTFRLAVSAVVLITVASGLQAEENQSKSIGKNFNLVQQDLNVVDGSSSEAIIPQEKMQQGIELYNKGKFAEAYKIFNELFMIKSDDTRVNFYLGRCATELKLYDDALEAFERVLLIEPTHVRSHMEIARIYFEEQSYDNAEAEFQKALEYPMPNDVKAQINKFLAVIAESKKKNFISGAFIVGFNMDTNVNNGNSFLPNGSVGSSTSPVFDYSMSETLAVNHIYKLNNDGWSWNNSLVLYNQHYRQDVAANLLFSQIGSGIAYKSSKYEISITPTVENLKYGMTHIDPSLGNGGRLFPTLFSKVFMVDRLTDMMDAVGIGEKFTMPLSEKLVLEQSLGYKYQFFKTADTLGMNAKVIDSSIGVKRALDDGKNIGFALTASRNLQADPTKSRFDVDQSSKGVRVDYFMPVQKYFDLAMNVSIKKVDYNDFNQAAVNAGIASGKQQDIQRGYGITATKNINPTTILSASFNKFYSDSTFETMVYQKNTWGVNLTKAF